MSGHEEEEYNWIDFSEWIEHVESGDLINVWSDGGCNPNPGPGGWGVVLEKGRDRTILTGGGFDTTNNRMEMIAALSGIDCLPNGCEVTLRSDSQYVIKGMSQWMYGWKKNGWVKKDGSDITNVDIWQEIYNVVRRHKVECLWVRGHNGNDENEMCDHLATQSRIKLEESERQSKYTTATMSKSLGSRPEKHKVSSPRRQAAQSRGKHRAHPRGHKRSIR